MDVLHGAVRVVSSGGDTNKREATFYEERRRGDGTSGDYRGEGGNLERKGCSDPHFSQEACPSCTHALS